MIRQWFVSFINLFLYRYDHTQTIIKKYNTYASKNAQKVEFFGRTVQLAPGKYTISCKTPTGWRIKTLQLLRPSKIHIKTFITK